MQSHNLQKSQGREHRRIGRGGKRGSFSGRGIKGQKARAGRRIRPQVRDIIKKAHKRRGYFMISHMAKPIIINMEAIEKNFKAGAKITKKSLSEKGFIPKGGKKDFEIKILGKGKFLKKFDFDKNILMSASVKKHVGKV